jgi:hypothetical protein
MSIPIISVYFCLGFVGTAGRHERRHPLAAGEPAMLDCSRVAVERIPAGSAAESRHGEAAARPM